MSVYVIKASRDHRRRLGTPLTYTQKLTATAPIAYWPLSESSGSVANCLINPLQNGTYSSDVSTWPPGPGIGDGNTAPFFDGTNDCIDIYTATLSTAFLARAVDEGTVMIWFKVASASVWADGIERYLFTLEDDAANEVICRKRTNLNSYTQLREGGNTAISESPAYTGTSWTQLAMTYSFSANEQTYYRNGAQIGSVETCPLAWTGTGLQVEETAIGCMDISPVTLPWHGWLAHFAVWDQPLTPAQIAALALVP